jgi:hypothetical protein
MLMRFSHTHAVFYANARELLGERSIICGSFMFMSNAAFSCEREGIEGAKYVLTQDNDSANRA